MTVEKVYEELYKEHYTKNILLAKGSLALGVIMLIAYVVIKNILCAVVGIGAIVIAGFGFFYGRSFKKNFILENFAIERHMCIKKKNRLATTGTNSILYFDDDLLYGFPSNQKHVYDEAEIGDKFDLAIVKASRQVVRAYPAEKAQPIYERILEAEAQNTNQANVIPAASDSAAVVGSEALAMFKSMMDQEEDAVVACDLLHQVIYANKAASMNGEVVGKTAFDLWTAEEMGDIQKQIIIYAKGSENDRILWKEDGNKKYYLGAVRDGSGKLIAYYERCREV